MLDLEPDQDPHQFADDKPKYMEFEPISDADPQHCLRGTISIKAPVCLAKIFYMAEGFE